MQDGSIIYFLWMHQLNLVKIRILNQTQHPILICFPLRFVYQMIFDVWSHKFTQKRLLEIDLLQLVLSILDFNSPCVFPIKFEKFILPSKIHRRILIHITNYFLYGVNIQIVINLIHFLIFTHRHNLTFLTESST